MIYLLGQIYLNLLKSNKKICKITRVEKKFKMLSKNN